MLKWFQNIDFNSKIMLIVASALILTSTLCFTVSRITNSYIKQVQEDSKTENKQSPKHKSLTDDKDKEYKIVYEIKGTATKINIAYNDRNGKKINKNNIKPPWKYEFTARDKDVLYLYAKKTVKNGDVRVTIYLDDLKLISTSTKKPYDEIYARSEI